MKGASVNHTVLDEASASFDTRDLKPLADKVMTITQATAAARDSIREIAGSLPRSTSLFALFALSNSGKHLYAGTVPAATVAKRRAKNRAARRARAVSRSRA